MLGPRRAFAATAFAFWVAMLGTTLPTPLYPLYQARYGFSQLLVTVVFATYAGGVLTALLAFGRLSDLVGRKRLLLPGLLLSALSAVAFLTAGGLPLLLVGRALSGLSAGIFTGTATAALLDLAPPAGVQRPAATLLTTAVNVLGLGSGPLLAGILVDLAGAPLRTCFAVDLALLAIATVLLLRVPETVPRRPGGRAALLRPRVPAVPPQSRGVFVQAGLAGFAGFAVLGLISAVAPAFLGQVLGQHDAAVTGVVVLAVFVASAAGQAALDRLGAARALPVGCGLLIAGMALLATALAAESLSVLVAGLVVAGLGQGLSFRAGLTAVTASAPPPVRGEVASAYFIVIYVAISLPVVGDGLLTRATDLRTAGLVFSAVVAALAAAVLVSLRRPAGSRPS